MKNIFFKKLAGAIAVLSLFVSCEDFEIPIYDKDNGQTLLTVFSTPGQLLPVPDTGATTSFEVGVTTISDTDRTVSLSIDPSSTADPSAYSVPSSVVIPAGSYSVEVPVAGNFDGVPELGLASVVVSVDAITDDNEVLIGSNNTHTIDFFRFCPFQGGATFTGDYQLETLSLGIFDVTTLTDGVVTISEGSTVADREFSIAAYPAFGAFSPFTFRFSLICGEIVVTAVDNINVGCGGGNAIGASTTVTSTYTEDDDSTIVINFVDDTRGQCQPPVEVAIRLTKI
ncbi:hypothetical protein [Maribacter sp. R77961]|uniref:hypothetical protein n=1 Tax=Maribacter sp. R77961 TaxID=3093871 RepID=UPI0037CCA569